MVAFTLCGHSVCRRAIYHHFYSPLQFLVFDPMSFPGIQYLSSIAMIFAMFVTPSFLVGIFVFFLEGGKDFNNTISAEMIHPAVGIIAVSIKLFNSLITQAHICVSP